MWQSPPPIVFSSSVPPCQFIMKKFTEYRDSGEYWYSRPFYSWPGGYKLCLKVKANGEGGKYVSVGVSELEGEYDGLLSWPPQCTVRVSILNLLIDRNHVSHHIQVEPLASPRPRNLTPPTATSRRTKHSPDTTRKHLMTMPLTSRQAGATPTRQVSTTPDPGSSAMIQKFISHASMKENPLTRSKYWSDNDSVCFRVQQCIKTN